MADKTPEEKAKLLADEQAAEIERLKAELELAKNPPAPAAPAVDPFRVMDEIKPGGYYIVDGSPVDSEGQPVKDVDDK